MRLIEDWQYKFIEKCLFNYHDLGRSILETERNMVQAIDQAMLYFKNQPHETMMVEYYFNEKKHRRTKTQSGHFKHVCRDLLYMEPSNGWVVRREIIYRISMNCYAIGVFKLK